MTVSYQQSHEVDGWQVVSGEHKVAHVRGVLADQVVEPKGDESAGPGGDPAQVL